MPVAGAVLVGGASRRMGRAKAWVEVGGIPMATRVASTLTEGGCDPVVFVGHVPGMPSPEVLPDLHPGQGPLGGVLTALAGCPGDVLVAACDLPHLDAATVRELRSADPAGTAAVVVARSGGHHVALALWRRSALAAVAAVFAAGPRSWRSVFERLPTRTVEIATDQALDVDTPDDLARAERRTGGNGPA